MTESDKHKREIRKRLFLSAARQRDGTVLHGLRWCQPCRGRGEICVEYSDSSSRWAAFEPCTQCAGEDIVAADDGSQFRGG
ncbi:hypothetical protein [Lysobacter sp. Hz 25]|uniref:hypothetical protein n=1 Tax=Lysobacter sp. Hz 25 TaxID=3383698 RepID=UPI0038D4500F